MVMRRERERRESIKSVRCLFLSHVGLDKGEGGREEEGERGGEGEGRAYQCTWW